MLVPPAVPPVMVPGVEPPVHTTFGAGVAALTMGVGKYESAKLTPVSALGLAAGLETTMVSVDVPPVLITFGENDLAIVGAAITLPVADALVVLNVAPSVCPL